MIKVKAAPVLTDEERTTAVGLARYAYEYIEAARLVADEDGDKHPGNQIAPVPAYFMAHLGVELTLKAYLRHQGVQLRSLSREYGHDLHACYRKAKELGPYERFNEHKFESDALWMLIEFNRDQGLRYIKTGMKHFPIWSLVEPLAVCLHQAVAPVVGFKTFTVTFGGYQ